MTEQVALVTGSSRGIGLATAACLAKRGFSIALNGIADDDELANAADAIQQLGVPVYAAAFDVTEYSQQAQFLSDVESNLGPLTTLVNNAGVGVLSRGDILDVGHESYDRCLEVNAKAVFFLCQAFAKRLMSRQRSEANFYSIINVTSSNAHAVAVQRGEYCASKAAASMISRAFAVRLGAENISVYDVQPGLIATEMTAPVIDTYIQRARDGLTVMPRVGQPEEVGQTIATLASGDLPYTTGHEISVDGGLLVPRF